MATKDDLLQLNITDDMLIEAVTHSLQMSFIDNLRNRSPFVQFDSKIRGYLGEIAIGNLLMAHGITIKSVDKNEEELGEDIDMTVANEFSDNIRLEIKTSLIPDLWKTLDTVYENADIKIIKREADYRDIKADLHIQIYFNMWRKARDIEMNSIDGSPQNYTIQQLIDIMKLKRLKEVFAAWIDKQTLIYNLDKKKYKTWRYGYRTFWDCPLSEAKKPNQIFDFIKSYHK